MPSLESLNLEALTPEVLGFLAHHGVQTVEDFVLHDLYADLGLIDQTPIARQCRQAVTDLMWYLESRTSGWQNGLASLQQAGHFVATGCASLDSLLQGGLQVGIVTEVAGGSSTGKSQLCMQAAAAAAYHLHSDVVYVDTCNAFSSQRVAELLGGLMQSREKFERSDGLGSLMNRIARVRIHDVFTMLTFLDDLHVASNSYLQNARNSNLRLLIIDSVSSVVSPILRGNFGQGHATMISLGQVIKKLASLHRLAVLITNHTVSGETGQLKPALGESWKLVPSVRLMLTSELNSPVLSASVLKHSSMECTGRASCRITRYGLRDVEHPENLRIS